MCRTSNRCIPVEKTSGRSAVVFCDGDWILIVFQLKKSSGWIAVVFCDGDWILFVFQLKKTSGWSAVVFCDGDWILTVFQLKKHRAEVQSCFVMGTEFFLYSSWKNIGLKCSRVLWWRLNSYDTRYNFLLCPLWLEFCVNVTLMNTLEMATISQR